MQAIYLKNMGFKDINMVCPQKFPAENVLLKIFHFNFSTLVQLVHKWVHCLPIISDYFVLVLKRLFLRHYLLIKQKRLIVNTLTQTSVTRGQSVSTCQLFEKICALHNPAIFLFCPSKYQNTQQCDIQDWYFWKSYTYIEMVYLAFFHRLNYLQGSCVDVSWQWHSNPVHPLCGRVRLHYIPAEFVGLGFQTISIETWSS